MKETFTYDHLNRLTDIWLNNAPTGHMAYDALGRMTDKRTDGRNVFSAAQHDYVGPDGRLRPHAVSSAETGDGFPQAGIQSIDYTMFDKVSSIGHGDKTLTYRYGYDHERIMMVRTDNDFFVSKTYVDNCELLDMPPVSLIQRTFLIGPLGCFAVAETINGQTQLHYVYKDHLGSWTTISDAQGNIEQEQSFDAWGNMRDPDTWTGTVTQQPMFDRGFTGHEHLNSFGLINMNGRMYDPVMSSFLSVDNYVSSPDFSQAFNRYAYCLNNPLKYTDPDGEFPWNIVIGAGIGAITGGWQAMQEGHNFWYGAWRGALTGAVGGALSCVGGGSFFANVAWGTAEGALTGTLNAALWGKTGSDFGKQVAVGAVMGFFFSSAQSLGESIGNYNDYGTFGTNDGVFDEMVQDAVVKNDDGTFYIDNNRQLVIDESKAQKALDFWTDRKGGPKLSYTANNNGSTSVYGDISIGKGAFLMGPQGVRQQICHEMGHYINNINWDEGKVGGTISDPKLINVQDKYFDGKRFDGVDGVYHSIENSGDYHIGYKILRNKGGKYSYYIVNNYPIAIGNPIRESAWKDYNVLKYWYLIPKRNYGF